jgi:deoxyxylulose-5-phosphate synthase
MNAVVIATVLLIQTLDGQTHTVSMLDNKSCVAVVCDGADSCGIIAKGLDFFPMGAQSAKCVAVADNDQNDVPKFFTFNRPHGRTKHRR